MLRLQAATARLLSVALFAASMTVASASAQVLRPTGEQLDGPGSTDGSLAGQLGGRTPSWQQVMGKLQRVATCGNGEVWGLNSGKVYRWNGSSWESHFGTLRAIDCGIDGTVWGLDLDSNLMRRNADGSWTPVGPTQAGEIGVGSAQQAAIIKMDTTAHRWNGQTFEPFPSSGFRQISVGADGAVWAINANGGVVRWTKAGWAPVMGLFRQVAVGTNNHVWAINARGEVFRFDGRGWAAVTSPPLQWISVDARGGVWGVVLDGSVVRR